MNKGFLRFKKLDQSKGQLLKEDLYKDRVFDVCPICASNKYVKFGFYNGIQRYRCKHCKRTFSKTTNSLLSYSKKNTILWINFIKLLLEKKSLRYCAKNLKINLGTAFFWRHKILNSLILDTTPDSLTGIIHISKAITKENFKGSRDAEILFSSNTRKNIFIIAATGKEDSMFIKPVFKGSWNLTRFNKKVYSKIETNSYIVPYGDRYLSSIARRHNKKGCLKTQPDIRIKYFIYNLKSWFSVFHGVATKYLQRYLALYSLCNLDKKVHWTDIIANCFSDANRFINTNKLRIIEDYLY